MESEALFFCGMIINDTDKTKTNNSERKKNRAITDSKKKSIDSTQYQKRKNINRTD
jgi:hypothetical protein